MNTNNGPLPSHDDGNSGNELRETREAMDRLNEANRVLVEAWMLPKDQALTGEQIKNVVRLFQRFIGDHKIKLAQAVRAIGYSATVLSMWTSGTYNGDIDAVTHAINDWVEREGWRRQAARPKDYIPTGIAEDIRTYVYTADKRLMMAAIVVPAGAGKTKVLKALAEEMRGIYIYCEAGMTVRDVYQALASELGWRRETGTRTELRKFIIEKLTGTHRILLLDEAHQLGAKLGHLRGIHDQARVPIVFCGTDEILELVNDRAHGRGQFSSRCIRYNALDFIRDCERPDGSSAGRDLFTIEEIKAFFAMRRIRLDRDSLRMLWALACLPSYGCIRLIENIVDQAFELAPDAETLTRSHIVQALHSLIGPEADHLQKIAGRHIEVRTPETAAA